MGVSSFIPEIWHAALLPSLKKAQVYASVCNRDYEGDIRNMGDTVHITSVSRPTVNDYTSGGTITVESLSTADRTLTIEKAKYFAFNVDDVDARQAAGNFVDGAMEEAAYAMSDAMDNYIAGKYTDIATANQLSQVSVTTGDIAYTQLTKLAQKLNEANVPKTGRWAVLPPWYLQLLTDSSRIAANPNDGVPAGPAVVEGFVGRLAGFDLLVSNNAPVVSTNVSAVIAGTRQAITLAEQINSMEAYRNQTTFADTVRGLHLFGAKVVRPDALAYLPASSV